MTRSLFDAEEPRPLQHSQTPWRLEVDERDGSLREFTVYDADGDLIEHYRLGAHTPERARQIVDNRRLMVEAVNWYARRLGETINAPA